MYSVPPSIVPCMCSEVDNSYCTSAVSVVFNVYLSAAYCEQHVNITSC